MRKTLPTRPGRRHPFGATPDREGTNFSVFSRFTTGMELLLYERADSREPFQVIRLVPEVNRTFFWWHVYVEGLSEGIYYTWRLEGTTDAVGEVLSKEPVELVDPRARAVSDTLWDRKRSRRDRAAPHTSIRGVVVGGGYDWEGDQSLALPSQTTIIYELHVGGFTRHASSGVKHPGTFLGLIEKIPYLKELGITHVELMPVMAFDAQSVPAETASRGLRNSWGYSPHSFFSPHPGYCVSAQGGPQEFRDMVKALHRAGIGVILDAVFNHTAEGGADGPMINFKGFAPRLFYHVDREDPRVYRDYTGCGNTINCSHPAVTRFLIDCLEYWVREMHVDGFRFDLASVFARGEDGTPTANAPIPWNLEFSETLASTKLIAEAWDAGGLYQVGAFPGYRWEEWNGRYRDVMRRFVRGERGLVAEVATRLSGSSDLYQESGRLPFNSINFITCHDGFTLWDLVSYDRKHNEANGQDNRDGSNANYSWNCGVEGVTTDPGILSQRLRQAKNFMAILLLSQGVPMLLAGDEVLRTQHGNNNAYCQDNEMSWLDWTLIEKNREMHRFVTLMIAFRKRHPSLMRRRFLTGTVPRGGRFPDVAWHGRRLHEPEWQDPYGQVLGFTLAGSALGEEDVHTVLNMSDQAAETALPWFPDLVWHRAVDTGQPSPSDILEPALQPPIREPIYRVPPRSVVVLEGRAPSG